MCCLCTAWNVQLTCLTSTTLPARTLTLRVCYRVIWVFLVLTSVGMFTYQLYWSVTFYLTFPVVVNVKVNHNATLTFPAVTICNLNAFR